MSRRDKISKIKDRGPQLLPSLLLCDFGNLEREIRQLEEAGIEILHLDVMDGHFVPNFTYGMTIVDAIRRLTDLFLDVHLMIEKPQEYVESFYEAGADLITFHAEAVEDPVPLLKKIRELGACSGLAFNPTTSVDSIAEAVSYCDLVLAMSIQPGFGGQKFQPEILPRFEQLRDLGGDSLVLEVDGGVNLSTIEECVVSGAEWLVSGSAIFKQEDYGQAIRELQESMLVNRD